MNEQTNQSSELPWDKRPVSARDILIIVGIMALACILTASLIVYVSQEDPGEEITESQITAALSTGDSVRGEALFRGTTELHNGAPACITCHRTAGIGPLGPGPNLTEVHERFGEDGLLQALQYLIFPSMKGMFSNRPLTDSEIADLNAYFAQTN